MISFRYTLFVWLPLLRQVASQNPVFAIVPKTINSPFYDVVFRGCEQTAADVNGECLYRGTETLNASGQAAVIDDLIANKDALNLTGIGVAVIDTRITGTAIDRAVAARINVVTFDSDAPQSGRSSYIATSNLEMGHSFAWMLAIGKPMGGVYGVISSSAPNTDQRVMGLQRKLKEAFELITWTAVGNATDCEDDADIAVVQLEKFAQNPNISAIVSVGGWPMYQADTSKYKSIVESRPDVLFLIGDSLPVQIDLWSAGYADGLVGQRPHEMGVDVVTTLLALSNGQTVEPRIVTPERIFFQERGTSTSGALGWKALSGFWTASVLVASLFVW